MPTAAEATIDVPLHIQAVVTVLSLINPGVCAGIFAQSQAGRPKADKTADATKVSLIVLVILVGAALAGTRVLAMFKLSLDAFMVAGGMVLAAMGFAMLSGRQIGPSGSHDSDEGDASLGPLVLFAASPGTITGVITLAAAHTKNAFPQTALVAVIVGTAVLWLSLLVSIRLDRVVGKPNLLSETGTRFMGLIVLAMGIQFGLQGLHVLD